MNVVALIWLGIFVALLLVEAITHDLVTLWFMVGALVAMITAFLGIPIWSQILVFVLVTGLSLYFLFPIVKKKLHVGEVKTNVDSLVGMRCEVTKAIAFNQFGQVSINGVIWTASGNESVEVGEHVEITGIEGNKVLVKKSE